MVMHFAQANDRKRSEAAVAEAAVAVVSRILHELRSEVAAASVTIDDWGARVVLDARSCGPEG